VHARVVKRDEHLQIRKIGSKPADSPGLSIQLRCQSHKIWPLELTRGMAGKNKRARFNVFSVSKHAQKTEIIWRKRSRRAQQQYLLMFGLSHTSIRCVSPCVRYAVC